MEPWFGTSLGPCSGEVDAVATTLVSNTDTMVVFSVQAPAFVARLLQIRVVVGGAVSNAVNVTVAPPSIESLSLAARFDGSVNSLAVTGQGLGAMVPRLEACAHVGVRVTVDGVPCAAVAVFRVSDSLFFVGGLHHSCSAVAAVVLRCL